MTAVEALASELFRLTEQDVRTPCHGADEWTSDHAQDRAHAAALCLPCPVFALCRQAADELKATYHVWGGRDRTAPTRPKPANRPMSHRVGREGHPNPMQGSPRQRGAKAGSELPFAAVTEPAPDAVPPPPRPIPNPDPTGSTP